MCRGESFKLILVKVCSLYDDGITLLAVIEAEITFCHHVQGLLHVLYHLMMLLEHTNLEITLEVPREMGGGKGKKTRCIVLQIRRMLTPVLMTTIEPLKTGSQRL